MPFSLRELESRNNTLKNPTPKIGEQSAFNIFAILQAYLKQYLT